jgi:sugar lactone lactonase YvrE
LRTGLFLFNFATAQLSPIAPAPYDTTTTRFNDGRADAHGRFWVGSIYEPRGQNLAALYVLEKNELRRVFGEIMVSNGLGFSPDNTILYHTDTATQTVSKYAFDSARGQIGTSQFFFKSPQVAATHADYLGRPDGAAVDSEGCYWVAMISGGRVLRISPQGQILETHFVPCAAPTMPCFGGADLKTLYVTTASQHPSVDLAKHPDSGCVFALRVNVAGLPEPYYQPMAAV